MATLACWFSNTKENYQIKFKNKLIIHIKNSTKHEFKKPNKVWYTKVKG